MISSSIQRNRWLCGPSVGSSTLVETTSLLLSCLTKAGKQLLHCILWRCHFVTHMKTSQPKPESSHPTPQTLRAKECKHESPCAMGSPGSQAAMTKKISLPLQSCILDCPVPSRGEGMSFWIRHVRHLTLSSYGEHSS